MYRALVLNTRKASGLCLSVRTCIIMQRRLAEEESASVSGLPPFKHAEALCTCNNACVKWTCEMFPVGASLNELHMVVLQMEI